MNCNHSNTKSTQWNMLMTVSKKTNSELYLNLEKARSDLGILESDNNEMHKEIQSLKYKIKSLENTNDEISRKNNEF